MKNAVRFKLGLYITTSVVALGLTVAPFNIDYSSSSFQTQKVYASCCFTAFTKILMADGSIKPIYKIEVGDQVMNRNGQVNHVRKLEIVRLETRKLFGFNDQTPFFTEEHPFLSPAGWRAISPQATTRENPKLRIMGMQTGDILVTAEYRCERLSGNTILTPDLQQSFYIISKITTVSAPVSTLVYNLMLDGDHTYIAEGFIVHNKDGGDGDSGDGDGDSGDDGGSDGDGDGDGGDDGDGSGDDGAGDDGGESGDDGAGDDGGEGGEGGDDGAGDDGSEGGEDDGSFSGSSTKSGSNLSVEQEKEAISKGWQ